jgi:hypothetical protein
MGVETEYALGGQSREAVVNALFALIRGNVPALPGFLTRDLFLSNGSRLYVDSGLHPELSTPECLDPADVVRYLSAGDRLLADALRELPGSLRAEAGTGLYKCNVDYSGAKTTWGSHESYLHRSPPVDFPAEIIPHLVSRLIFTGAGGFNPFSSGIEFTLSPRSWHLGSAEAPTSIAERGIFHTKDEPLARGGYHRMHLLCGESLCSRIANWLRVGTTALVVASIDAGGKPGSPVRLKDPVAALRAFAADQTCRTTVKLERGECTTAIAIQRQFLREVKRHLSHGAVPEWARDVCEVWGSVLDTLEFQPDLFSTTLDWAIKLAVYKERASQKGIRWEDLPVWNEVIRTIMAAVRKSGFKDRPTVEVVLGREGKPSPIPGTIAELTPFVESHSLSWDMLRPIVNLRKELFELDFRFGHIGEGGVFEELDRAGVLTHDAPGVENIESAMTEPPSRGRARARGEHVKAVAGRQNFACSWTGIIDLTGGRKLDLSNPFVRRGRWRRLTRTERSHYDTSTALSGGRSGLLWRSRPGRSVWSDLFQHSTSVSERQRVERSRGGEGS